MPLSDEEARLLHQLEQSLAAEDPDFASTLRGSKMIARSRRSVALSSVGFIAGLVLLFTGAISANTWLGVGGFVIMLASAYVLVGALRRAVIARGDGSDFTRSGPGPKQSGSFVDRMEERWQRRQNGDDI